MATAAENLQAAQNSLAESAANVAARLAELDAMPLDAREAKATYSQGGISYDWNGYRASLLSQLQSLGAEIESIGKAAQIIGGPFTIVGRAQDGMYG